MQLDRAIFELSELSTHILESEACGEKQWFNEKWLLDDLDIGIYWMTIEMSFHENYFQINR